MKSIVKNMVPMLTVCTIAGVILTVLAPYGTSVFSPVSRFVYWVGLCLAGGFGASAANAIAYAFKREFGPWQMALVQSVTSTLAVSTIILIMALATYGMPSVKNFFQTMFYVWVIAAVISSIGALLSRQKNNKPAPERAALYERLPPHLRSAEIYALAAEDHYVRVITARGDELLLMRLSDAIRETAPLKGLSPHRSWWVAESGVDKIKKSEIILKSEQTVPISRTGMKQVREAGWK